MTVRTRRAIVNDIQREANAELLNEAYREAVSYGDTGLTGEAGKAVQSRMKRLTGRTPVAAEYAPGHTADIASEIGNLYIYGVRSDGGQLRLETSHGIREIGDITLKNGVTPKALQEAYNYGLMGVDSLAFGNSRLPQSQLTRMAYEQGLADAGGSIVTKGAGDLLPNVEKVTVDTRKVTEYALNPNNTSGGANKAQVFESALGYNQSNSNHLMQQIQAKLPTSKAIRSTTDKYGQRFMVDIPRMTTIFVK